ncbi:hypothetical protein NONO_c65480 [Nocardia nova SH22a]|uniref:Uncharacterized protein n=1 Tax=Nocardia nova SH22a TaxID=1415166 RepID=W5TQU2_9NOCA|nr:hypothetical protein NONO_c65480 [Nocardia nova SH22a]
MTPTFAPPSSPLEALMMWLRNSLCTISADVPCIYT